MNGYKKTILAIDDDITTLTTLRTILDRSYDVSLAKNADIAQTILKTAMVDLILLDMEMPSVSGMDLLKTIRNNCSLYSIPIIVVSSYGMANVIVNTQKMGALDFIVKPISAKILLEKIQAGLKTARKKISKAGLYRKLQALQCSCANGRTSQIEKVIRDLDQYCFNLETDTEIAEICKDVRKMEYTLADEKIKLLLSQFAD